MTFSNNSASHDKYIDIRDYRARILRAPRTPKCWLKPFNASRRLEGNETKIAVRNNSLDTAFESNFALDGWSYQLNIWSAELDSFPDSHKISDKYWLRGPWTPCSRGHDAIDILSITVPLPTDALWQSKYT